MPCPLDHKVSLFHQGQIVSAVQQTLIEERLPYVLVSDPNHPDRETVLIHIWTDRIIGEDPSSWSISIHVQKCGCMLAEIPDDPEVQAVAKKIRAGIERFSEIFALAQDAAEFLKQQSGRGMKSRPARRPGRNPGIRPGRRR